MNTSTALKKNDIITLTAESIMQNGNAVAHTDDGFVVFIVSGAVGDVVNARILKVTKNYAVAKIESIVQPSSARFDGGCLLCGKCGGCVFQHITYEAESQYKKNSINNAFERIAKLPLRLEAYYPMDNPSMYRNKAVYPIGSLDDGTLISGFYAQMSHRIVRHDKCLIGNPIFTEIVNSSLDFLTKMGISAYNEQTQTGLLRSIYLRSSIHNKISVTFIINSDVLLDKSVEKALSDYLVSNFSQIVTILINVHKSNSNAVTGKEWRVIYGDGYLFDELCSKNFRITPASFWQVNNKQACKLYDIAKEYAALQKGEVLLDLYCGTGSVGICIADNDTKLFGVEVIPEAVVDAQYNAKLNGIDAKFLCLEAKNALDDPALKNLSPDVITIDPPRKGCADSVEKIARLGAKRIVYISCDSATLARDIALFDSFGYKAVRASGVDMFPRTGHVECVVRLCRNEHSSI